MHNKFGNESRTGQHIAKRIRARSAFMSNPAAPRAVSCAS
ncbi:hypothetical protein LC55x_2275 [Lysobacter capsici]|nr:hypothetical protein LC55x_2275 [Lysobacter capsici]